MSEKPDNDNRPRAAREAYESIGKKNLTASERLLYESREILSVRKILLRGLKHPK